MGSIFGLNFESREERERKAREYADWIFPQGKAQKERVLERLTQKLPGFKKQDLLLHYILIKEALLNDESMDFHRAVLVTEHKTSLKNTLEVLRCFQAVLEEDFQTELRERNLSTEIGKVNRADKGPFHHGPDCKGPL